MVHSQPGLRRGSLHVDERQMEKVCVENVIRETGCGVYVLIKGPCWWEEDRDCGSHLNKSRTVTHVPSLEHLHVAAFCGRQRGNEVQQVTNGVQELNLGHRHGL